MPGYLFHVGAGAMCSHAGQAATSPSQQRVRMSGSPVVVSSDISNVAGCGFNSGSAPHPCMTVQWLAPAARVRVNGQPVVLQSSTGICKSADQTPQGPPIITSTQTRVMGS